MPISLFDPIALGAFKLKNRVFMAPMTRGRSDAQGAPEPYVAEYYAQRAEAGLIITEAVAINARGDRWPGAPGLYTDHHQAGWKRVADAVHEKDGTVFMQLWHMGAAVIPDHIDGAQPVAPSRVAAKGEIPDRQGVPTPFATPKELTQDEIKGIVQDFADSAARAIEAGIDGVEIHAGNCFLIDQFLRDGMNKRTDAYGGSVPNRARFLLEVTDAVIARIGAGRVGVRISPTNAVFGISDSDPEALFTYVAGALSDRDLAYLHILEPANGSDSFMSTAIPVLAEKIREAYTGLLILNGALNDETGSAVLKDGRADAIAFAVPFIANPDLVTRYRNGLALSEPDQATFYTPGEKGLTDYLPAGT